jgi:hypothetical protein
MWPTIAPPAARSSRRSRGRQSHRRFHLKQVHSILDAHYLKREESMAIDAVRKREWHEATQKIPN